MKPQQKNTLLLALALLVVLGIGFVVQKNIKPSSSTIPTEPTVSDNTDTTAAEAERSTDELETAKPENDTTLDKNTEQETEQGSDTLKAGLYAVLVQNGLFYRALPLSEDTELRVEDGIGGYNTVRIEDGRVFVEDANCGDLTCVRMGEMYREGDIIACLPHALLIYVEEVPEEEPAEDSAADTSEIPTPETPETTETP